MTLKEQLAARKEVILRRRAARGESFTGVGKAKKELAEFNKQRSVSNKITAEKPLKDFKEAHNGLDYEEWDRAVAKGLTLEEVLQAPNKRILSGPTKETYPSGVYERVKQKARREGLADKRTDCKNDQLITWHNPRGSGVGATSDEHAHTKDVLALADRMKGIDLSAIPGVYDTKYGPEVKLHAVITWLLTGNLSQTERVLDLREGLVSKWKRNTEWWPLLAKAVQQERATELDAELTTLITDTSDTIKDRLKDGDYKYNAKLDKLVRVPVQAKEAAVIMDKAITNRNLLRGDPTSRTESVSVTENLSLLKQEFQKFANAKTIEGEHESTDSDD